MTTATFIPQTSNFGLMLDVLDAIKGGLKNTSEVAQYLMLDSRNVRYHLASLASLGLISADGFDWSVTKDGEYVQTYDSLFGQMVNMPSVKAARGGIANFISFALNTGLSMVTAKRRWSTVKEWARISRTYIAAEVIPVPVTRISHTHCPSCFIALPKLARDECDTCGTSLI